MYDGFFKVVRIFAIIFLMANMILAPVVITTVTAQEPGLSEPCGFDGPDPNCDPPSLREVEYLAVRVLYGVWACGGLIFTVLLVIIGFTYMISGGDPQKVEAAKKRAGQWVLGMLLFFFAQPITASFMRALVADNSDCFENLEDPGFTFFFSTVCTEGDGPIGPNTPQGTPLPSNAPIPTAGLACESRHNDFCNSDVCSGGFIIGAVNTGNLGDETVRCFCVAEGDGVCQTVLDESGVSPECTAALDTQCESECADIDLELNVPIIDPVSNELTALCQCDGQGSGRCLNVFTTPTP